MTEGGTPVAEPPERVAEGTVVSLGSEEWQNFRVGIGEVLEFMVDKNDGIDFPIRCAMIVTEVKDFEGQVGCYGRFIGSEDSGKNRDLSNTINHRDRGVHLCQMDPCDSLEGNWAAHVTRARWWTMEKFPRNYLKVWGVAVLDEGIRIGYPGEGIAPRRSLEAGRPRHRRREIPSLQRRKRRNLEVTEENLEECPHNHVELVEFLLEEIMAEKRFDLVFIS